MTATQLAERQIVQILLHRQKRPRRRSLTERFITGLALAAALAIAFIYLQELLWVMLAVALIVSLGFR